MDFDYLEEKVPVIRVIMLVIVSLLLVLTCYMHVKEILLISNGNSITTKYRANDPYVTVQDESGKIYVINMEGLPVKSRENEIDLYYYGNKIATAKPLTPMYFWVVVYGFFGILFIILFFSVRASYKASHIIHAKE